MSKNFAQYIKYNSDHNLACSELIIELIRIIFNKKSVKLNEEENQIIFLCMDFAKQLVDDVDDGKNRNICF